VITVEYDVMRAPWTGCHDDNEAAVGGSIGWHEEDKECVKKLLESDSLEEREVDGDYNIEIDLRKIGSEEDETG
jgi:hypothetical protein